MPQTDPEKRKRYNRQYHKKWYKKNRIAHNKRRAIKYALGKKIKKIKQEFLEKCCGVLDKGLNDVL